MNYDDEKQALAQSEPDFMAIHFIHTCEEQGPEGDILMEQNIRIERNIMSNECLSQECDEVSTHSHQ